MKVTSFLRKPVGFEGRFTQIPNSWARDERLGYRARGILLLLMSHQDGWKISLEHLANDGPDGITAVRTAISQLQEFGYLTRNQIRNEMNQIEGSEWIISDPFEEQSEPQLENLILGNQSENLILGNLTLKNTISKEDNRKLILEQFERFWKIYPRRVGKSAALKSFEKALVIEDPEVIISRLIAWAERPLPEMRFIPHPATWLNQGRWQDDIDGTIAMRNASTIAADIMIRANAMNSIQQQELE